MIGKVLQSIKIIPAFPPAALKLLNLIREGDYSIMDIVNVVKFDPSITANILKLSNSAYFCAPQKITTIHEAVVNLGQNNLLQVVQAAGISMFYKKPVRGYLLTPRGLWRHCVAVALMSQILSHKIYRKDNPVLYTAALLHDVGKIILGEFVYNSLEKITELVSEQGRTCIEAEKEVLGIDHAELGGKIADQWKFPDDLKDPIALHHNPGKLDERDAKVGTENKVTPSLVYFSDQLCVKMGISGGSEGYSEKGLDEMLKTFSLHQSDIDSAVSALQEGLIQAQDMIDVVPE